MIKNHLQFILDHVSPRLALMETGCVTDCEGLFDPMLWDSVPPSERRYVFGRPIAMLVAQGKILLKFVGFNSARHNLYRKK